METVWAFKVNVQLGYQWWVAAYQDQAEAQAVLLDEYCPDAEILEAKRVKNWENLKDGEIRRLPEPLHPK